MEQQYDAFLLVSFGGPEGRDDVIPFLENVLRGRNVPRSRLEEVADHYYKFDGVSPINGHCRALLQALKPEFEKASIRLPIYWGNRNWHPMLAGTIQKMAEDGVKRALAFVTSAYSSYSSCRQYLEDIEKARNTVGAAAPIIDKLRPFYNHPKFIEVNAQNVRKAVNELASIGHQMELEKRSKNQWENDVQIAFTAHSIPATMASGCQYSTQLTEVCRLVAEKAKINDWALAYQSRSGPPTQPWLGPDIGEHLRTIAGGKCKKVVICPIGFISDHMEVIYDLDHEAKAVAEEVGLQVVRAQTAGVDPLFIEMVRMLVDERLQGAPRLSSGNLPSLPDLCPVDCCAKGY
jgi:ferrochelatase